MSNCKHPYPGKAHLKVCTVWLPRVSRCGQENWIHGTGHQDHFPFSFKVLQHSKRYLTILSTYSFRWQLIRPTGPKFHNESKMHRLGPIWVQQLMSWHQGAIDDPELSMGLSTGIDMHHHQSLMCTRHPHWHACLFRNLQAYTHVITVCFEALAYFSRIVDTTLVVGGDTKSNLHYHYARLCSCKQKKLTFGRLGLSNIVRHSWVQRNSGIAMPGLPLEHLPNVNRISMCNAAVVGCTSFRSGGMQPKALGKHHARLCP